MAANVSGTLFPTRSVFTEGVSVDLASPNHRRRHCKFTRGFHISEAQADFSDRLLLLAET